MRRAVLMSLGAALALNACGRPDRAEERSAPSAPAAAAPASEAADAAAGSSSGDVDFVGVWAERPDLCDGGQTWRFTHERLSAASGVSCAIEGAARSAEGWSLQAVCTPSGPAEPAALTLAAAGSTPASAVTISGGPFVSPVSLVRCTPPLSVAGGR